MTWITLIIVVCASLGLIVAGLRMQHAKKSSAGAALVLLGCIVAVHLVPLHGFPWPLLSEKQNGRYVNILSSREAWLFDVVQWGLATGVFALAARRVRAAWLVPLACVVVVAVLVAVHVAVRMSGRDFYWVIWR